MSELDISGTLTPKSDQLNAEDLLGGPIVARIDRVTVPGGTEQPVHVHLVGFSGRPWKPCKTMRRLLAVAWGADAARWVGRSVKLYREPTVRFGDQGEVGGIRIAALSDIPRRITVKLTATRGKRAEVACEILVVEQEPTPPSVQALGQAIEAAKGRGWTREQLVRLLGADSAARVEPARRAECITALAGAPPS